MEAENLQQVLYIFRRVAIVQNRGWLEIATLADVELRELLRRPTKRAADLPKVAAKPKKPKKSANR